MGLGEVPFFVPIPQLINVEASALQINLVTEGELEDAVADVVRLVGELIAKNHVRTLCCFRQTEVVTGIKHKVAYFV